MRLFLGIPLTGPQQEKIISLYPGFKNVKPVKRENLHITLKFLGEISGDNTDKIKAAMASACFGAERFVARTCFFSAFPREERARIIWAGVDDKKGVLRKIYKRLEQELGKAGFEKDKRKFVPHITVGRARRPAAIKNYLKKIRFDICIDAESVVLFESDLKKEGAVYRPVYKEKFGCGAPGAGR